MKRIIVSILSLIVAVSSHAQYNYDEFPQRNRGKYIDCIERIQRLDSVKGFKWDNNQKELIPSYIFNYRYNNNSEATEVIRLILPSREYSNRQINIFNKEGLKISYLYQVWINGAWADNMLTRYSYNADGSLGNEIFSHPGQTRQWVPYQQYYYEYDSIGRRTLYLRQMNYNDLWTDFSKVFYKWNGDLLTERYEERLSDHAIIWQESYIYNDQGIRTDRFRQVLEFDPVSNTLGMVNSNHQTYFYDIFGDLSYVEQETWADNEWIYSGRQVYYYSLVPGKKVCLCHNGNTISVSTNAVASHLKHGDKLGICSEETQKQRANTPDLIDKNQHKPNPNEIVQTIVFPNPVKSCLDLQISSVDHPYKWARLYNRTGNLILMEDIKLKTSVSLDLHKLTPGEYFLKLTGDNIPEKVHIIIKQN